MNKKLTLIIALFSLLTLSAAAWLAYETATLDTRLLQIDKEAQQKLTVLRRAADGTEEEVPLEVEE